MAVKLPDTLVPMADFPSAFAKDVQFTDGENLQDKLDKGKLGSSSGGTGLTEEQANNIEKIPSIEGIVTSNSEAITNKADKDHEHTEYLKEIPDEYVTETELEAKGYLTEHQSLTDYAKKTDIPDVSDFLTEVPAGYVTDTELSTELDKKVNKEVDKGLSTNDLTNELVIKINSSATEAFVTNAIANAQLGSGEVDLSGYATVDALNLKADLTHTHDQYLTEVPDEYITETELTDKNYADKEYVTQAVSNVNVDLTEYAKTSDIPTKVSQLTNDSNFITTIPEEYITETELANELSTINVKTYTNITQLGLTAPVITGKIYNVLPENSIFQCEITDNKTVSDTPENTGMLTIQKSSKRLAIEFKACARYSVFPNNLYLGQLKGDDGSGITWNKVALSSDLEGCVTDTELSSKGYATETFVTNKIAEASLNGSGVDLSGYATKDDVPTKTSELTNDSNFVTNSKMLEAMADLILDTEVRIDKTYSSSKIHADIQQCLEDSKTYTLEELGKKIGASYEVVTSIDDMVSKDRLYLLKNGNNYDIYIVDVDNVPVVIGDTTIDLSGYVTKTEIESELGTERLGTTSQTVKGAINELFQSVTNEGDITDLENRITTNETNITGLQEQIDNLDIPDVEITNVLTNNSTINQIPNAKLVADEIHGKSIFLADYSDALKIPTGKWRIDSTEKAGLMKNLPVSEAGILEVKYLHGNDETTVYTSPYKYAMFTYTVITGDKYERALSSGAVGSITRDTGWRKIINENSSELTNINTKLTQLETKAALIPVVADNPTDYDLNNYKENGNYSIGDSSKYSNAPISRPGLLTVIRSNSYRLQIYTAVNNDDVYFRKSTDWGKTWTSWVLLNGSSGASGNEVYTSTRQEIGTWMGKKLYKHSYHSIGAKTSIKDGTTPVTNVDKTKYELVKIEAVFRMGTDSSNIVTYQMPFVDFNKNASMIAFQDRDGMVCFTAKNLSDYKDYGEDITVYYTDK